MWMGKKTPYREGEHNSQTRWSAGPPASFTGFTERETLLHCSLVQFASKLQFVPSSENFSDFYEARRVTEVSSFAIPHEETLQIQRCDFNRRSVILDQERATATDPLRTEDNQHPSAARPPRHAVPGKNTVGSLMALSPGQRRKSLSEDSRYHTNSC